MKIAVNTRLLLPNRLDGIGWYTHETLRRMVLNHPEHEFLFLFDRPFDQQFIYGSNVTPIVVPPPARHPVLWWMWFDLGVHRVLKKHDADVFLSQDGYLSLRSKVPAVNVMHDINFEHFPKQLPFLVRHYYRHFFPRFAQKAKVLVTVSESSKRDIAAHYGLHEDKIAVVYNGVNEIYGEQAGVEQTEIRKRYSNGQPFLLFVGSLHERKNIQRMLLAFEDFKERTRSPLHFIIAGKKMWWTSAMEATLNGLKHRNAIHFTGRIDPVETLRDVVAAAEAMIYVPTFEGFGVPVVEAQLAGVPVITSNVSSLPEAAGEGALLCDPYSVTAISDAMETITSNATLREELLIKGKANARRYDWDQSAINLWECILKATK